MPEASPRGAVLIVDDSNLARAAVSSRLVDLGLEVCGAVGCADGAAVDLETVGVAILDLELGDGNGVDLARTLRTTSAVLPIAFLTSAPTSRLAGAARELGPVFEKGSQLSEAVAWAAAQLSG